MKTLFVLLLLAFSLPSCTSRESYIASPEPAREEVILSATVDGVTILGTQHEAEERIVLKIMPTITNMDTYIRIEVSGTGSVSATHQFEILALSKNLKEGYYIEEIVYLPKGIKIEGLNILEVSKL